MSLEKSLSILDEYITEKKQEIIAAKEEPSKIEARTWNVDGQGFCPDCGKIMRASMVMGHKVLLCESDRVVLPMPDNYTPPTVESKGNPASEIFSMWTISSPPSAE